jgi:hypothetical protein
VRRWRLLTAVVGFLLGPGAVGAEKLSPELFSERALRAPPPELAR